MGIPVSSPLENLKITRTADAAADEVVRGDDSRMTNARSASDVYSWAKAATKPSYSYSEVGAAAASHTHAVGDIQVSTNNVILGRVTAGAGGAEEITCTAAGRALLDDADAAAQRTTLGLGDAATKNVGSSAGTVCAGNDSRLTDARTPLSHVHGNISNAGAIGSTADLPIKTGASGVLTAGAWGTTAGTFCQGNDSRLSDARAPTAHKSSHATGGSDALTAADIGAVGLASPAFTGTPTAPTAAVGTDTTQLATTAFVNAEIANDAMPVNRALSDIGVAGTYIYARDDNHWTGEVQTIPGYNNAYGVISMHLHSGDYYGQLHLSAATADLGVRFKNGTTSWGTTYRVLHSGNYTSYAAAASHDHASISGSAGSVAWSGVTSKPNTLAGYGITDAAASSHTHSSFGNISIDGNLLSKTVSDYDMRRIVNPLGGSRISSNSTETGAIKIRLPVKDSAHMVRITVKIYEYIIGKSRTLEIGGYNYISGNWYNYFAHQASYLGGAAANLTVRFGQDASRDCIWIGELNTGWTYPQIYITEVQIGYGSTSASFLSGWEISIVTAFDTVEQAIDAYGNIHAGNIGDQSVSYASSAGSVAWSGVTSKPTTLSGYGITDAATSGHTHASFGNLDIYPTSEGWGEGIQIRLPSTSTWGGIRWTRDRGNSDGNWGVGYTSLDSTDDLVFIANNGGTQINNILRMQKDGKIGINIHNEGMDANAKVTCQGQIQNASHHGDNAQPYYQNLQLREHQYVAANQSAKGYSPGIGFHWGGRSSASLIYYHNGEFQFINSAVNGYNPTRASAFNQESKRESKENILSFDRSGVEIIENTAVMSFTYKNDEGQTHRVGFIAEETDPLLTGADNDCMDIANVVGVLMKAVQELSERNRMLDSRIVELEAREA